MPISRRGFVGSAALPGLQRSGRPRNVLFLLSDQHKPGCLSVDGHQHARTPALDSLARSGMRFQQAYCTYPICGPARASLWTGLYAHHHRVVNNGLPWPADVRSIADSFRAAGYQTGAIGKMHFADPHNHGFDYRLDFNDWYQYLGPQAKLFVDEVGRSFEGDGHPEIQMLWRGTGDPWKGKYEPDGREGMTHVGRPSKIPETHHFESFVARESIEYLKRYAKKGPFFLVSSFLKPHQPFMPADRFASMYRAEDMRLPVSWGKADPAKTPRFIQQRIRENPLTPELLDPGKAVQRIASYYGCIAQMDDCLGQVLAALREAGLEDDTIVVYTSDHGELLGEHSLWQKFVFYEASLGVPLILRVPGMTRPGSECPVPVSHVRLAPTLADLCGVTSLARFDGESLAPLIRDPAAKDSTPVFAEYDLGNKNKKYMIRSGDWKYCHYHDDLPELFDLGRDRAEMANLAADPASAPRLEALRARLFEWNPEAKAAVPGG